MLRSVPRRVSPLVIFFAVASACASDASAFVWPNVPERVARALSSADPSERRTAAQKLRELPAELAKPLVEKALGDSDAEVRVQAAAAASQLRLEGAGDRVIPWLSETDSRLRLAACDVILAAPTPRAVQALGRVLADQSPQVRLAAAHAMGASSSPDAVSPLLGHLDDNAPEVRSEVARALGRLGDARAVLPLVSKVQDSSAEVRRRVARSLGELGDQRAVSALVLALGDASLDVRLESVRALGKLASDEATVALTPLAQGLGATEGGAASSGQAPPPSTETNLALRQAALAALGRIGSTRAMGVLIEALDKDRPDALRMPAHDALVAIGPSAVKPLLAYLSGSPTPQGATGAVLTLGELADASAVDPIVRGMRRGAVPLPAGLSALAKLGSPSALPAVLELIDDPDPKVRSSAIRATKALLDPTKPDGRAVEPVSAALAASSDLLERIDLVALLGRTGAPRAEPTLLALASASREPAGSPARTKNLPLRRAALSALGVLGSASAEVDRTLLAAVDDEDGGIRADAALALAKVGTEACAAELLSRLVEAAEQDRGALGIALSGVLSRSKSDALAKRVGRSVDGAPDLARDALIEGLGRMPSPEAKRQLADLAKLSVPDRRKVAEALAGQAHSEPELRSLVKDADPSVRATAAWSLGKVGGVDAVSVEAALLADPDPTVAGNAVAALGRLAPRLGDAASIAKNLERPLCAAVTDPRSYVRANALSSLRLAGLRCAAAPSLLASDPSDTVRLAAADYLRASADPAAPKLLSRCLSDDPNAMVAERCDVKKTPRGRPSSSLTTPGAHDLSVFVVPDGRDLPVAGAPFTLVLPDGSLRMGVADRRGALFETAVPDGIVELGVPAALAQ